MEVEAGALSQELAQSDPTRAQGPGTPLRVTGFIGAPIMQAAPVSLFKSFVESLLVK